MCSELVLHHFYLMAERSFPHDLCPEVCTSYVAVFNYHHLILRNFSGYIIEYQSGSSPRWVKVSKTLVAEQNYVISGLSSESRYNFRIYAENKVGIGVASDSTGFVELKDPLCEPDEPGTNNE